MNNSESKRGEDATARVTGLLTSEWFLVGIILLIGLGLRLWFLSEIIHAPDFTAPQQDADVQDYQARAMATGDWTVRPGENDPEIRTTPYFRPPGYPYFLSAVYFMTNGSYLAPRIINMFLGLASIVLMYLLAKSIFGRGTAMVAALFMATYWVFIYWEGELNDPVLFVFLGLCLMHVLRLWRLKMTFSRAFAAGLIVGGYALMRPNILLFGPFIAAWMLWTAWRQKHVLRMIPAWAGLALAPLLVIAPVTIRNYVVSREFVPISTYFGENFLIGNGEDSDGVTPWTPYLQQLEGTGHWSVWVYNNVVKGLGKELGKPKLGHAEASSYFFHKTLDFVKEHKLRTLKLALKKAVLFWSPLEITCNKVVQDEKEFYPPLKYLPGFPLVMGLFIAGCFLLAYNLYRRRVGRFFQNRLSGVHPDPVLEKPGHFQDFPDGSLEMIALIVAFNAVYFVSFLPFFVNGRARVPVIPFMLLLGSYAVYAVLEAAVERAYVKAAFGAGCLGLLYFVCGIQLAPYAPDHARWHYQHADSYLRLGQEQEAIDEGRVLLDMGTGRAYMHQRLGEDFARRGLYDEAVLHYQASLKAEPDFQDLYYLLAKAFVKLHQPEKAEAEYEEALRLNPDDARAHHELGALLAAAGKTDEAIRHYKEALRVAPHFGAVLDKLGRLLVAQGKPQEALAIHEAIIRADPYYGEAYYYFGRELATQGRLSESLVKFKKAIELDPTEPRTYNDIAAILGQMNKPDEAIKNYEMALKVKPDFTLALNNWGDLVVSLGRYKEAEGKYWEALEIRATDEYAYYNLAHLADRDGRTDAAIDFYQKGMKNCPENSMIPNDLGYLYSRLGNSDEAVKWYKYALGVDPKNPLLYNNLGYEAYKHRRFDEAISYYQQALAILPVFVLALNNMGTALGDQNKIDESIASYAKALKIRPDDANIQNNIGYQYYRKGDYTHAMDHYQEAVRLVPRFPLAYNNMGQVHRAQKDFDNALACFKKALEIYPQDEFAHFNIAGMFMDEERIDDAITEYENALKNAPKNPDIANELANALVRKNNIAEATKYYARALEIDPNHVGAHCNLGNILLATGRVDDAIAHFQKALQASPDSAAAQEGLKKAQAQKK